MIPQGFVTGQSIQAIDFKNRYTLAQNGYSVIDGCEVTISSGTLGSGNGAVHVNSGTVFNDFTEVSVSAADVDVPVSDDSFPRKDVVVYDTSDSTLKTFSGTAEEIDPPGATRQDAERPAPPDFDTSVEFLSSNQDPAIPLAEIWIPEGAESITSNDLFDSRTQPLNASSINNLNLDDFASQRRTLDVDVSGQATDDRILIGRISDGTASEDGKFVAHFYNSLTTGANSTSQIVLNCGVRQSNFNASHYYFGIKQATNDENVDFVVTETSGTGTNGNNEYYLYVDPANVTDGTLVIERADSFGEFDYTEGLTTSDYIGTPVYETRDSRGTTTVEFGEAKLRAISGPISDNVDVTDIDGNRLTINSGVLDSSHTNVSDDGTQTLSDTDDINFGTNLTVTDDGDNSVTVDYNGSGTTELLMSNYSSGGVSDSAFESAISDATAGDTIVFDRNSYELANGHQITKSLTIDQTSDAEILCTNTSNTNASFEFLGGGTTGLSTTTTSALSKGSRTIPVNDSSIFAVDDHLLVIDQGYSEQVDSPAQFVQIKSIPDATTVNIMGSTLTPFISGANVYQVDLLESPKIQNITTSGGGDRHVQFRWTKDAIIEDSHISEYLEHSPYFLDCLKPTARNVTITDPMGIGSGEGEAIAAYRCTDVLVESPRVYDCRRGVDFAWGTYSVDVNDPIIHGADIAAIAVHQDDEAGMISVSNGTITNRPNSTTGYGIINSADASMSVEGTHFITDRAGIAAAGTLRASDCHFEPVGSSAQNAIQVVGSNAHFKNCTIEDPNAHYNEPVRIDTRNGSLENVSIEAEIEYTDQTAVIINTSNSGGGTINDVKLRGSIRGGTTDQPIFIWAEQDTIDQVDISMDVIDTAGQCIRLTADSTLGTVRVHDCTLESTDSAVIFDDGSLGSSAVVWMSNCYCDSGSGGTTISFNDSMNTLFVLGCYASATIDTSGTITNLATDNNLP